MAAESFKKNLIRRLNLLMLLLNHPRGQTKTEIFNKVPEYSFGRRPDPKESASRDRAFSRDKEGLAEAGFPVSIDDQSRYFVKHSDVFSPAVSLDREQRRVLCMAAAMWRGGSFKVSVQAALLKLGIVPGAFHQNSPVAFNHMDDKILAVAAALIMKSPISFKYRTASKDSPSKRTLEPWAIIGRYGHWYLHAMDVRAKILKFFRLDRITGDIWCDESLHYDIPATYDPQEYEDKIQFPEAEKYCTVAGDEKYLAAVPLEAVSGADGDMGKGYGVFRYRSTKDAAASLVPFLDTIKVLQPRQLQDAVVSYAKNSLKFQEQVTADESLSGKNAARVRKDAIPDILRVLGIAMLNANRKLTTYGMLLDYLGIEEEQLIEDLHALNYIETPVDAAVAFGYIDVEEINQEGEFTGAAGYSLPEALQLTFRQITALIMSLRIFYSYAQRPDRIVADSLIEKFSGLAQTYPKALETVYACPFSTASEKDRIIRITESIKCGKVLCFDYLDGIKTSYGPRQAIPWGTYSVDGRWYLQAWCCDREAARIFRCDRMRNINVVEGNKPSVNLSKSMADAAPKDFAGSGGAEIFERAFAEGGDLRHDVTVALREGSDRFVKDYFAYRIKKYRNHPLANQVAQVTIRDSDYFARLVVSSGGRIAVVSPAEDSQRCRHYAQKIIGLYGKQEQ